MPKVRKKKLRKVKRRRKGGNPGIFILTGFICCILIWLIIKEPADKNSELAKTETISDELGTHVALSYNPEGCLAREGVNLWQPLSLEAGKPFNQPSPLVKKLDHSIVEEERARLGK